VTIFSKLRNSPEDDANNQMDLGPKCSLELN